VHESIFIDFILRSEISKKIILEQPFPRKSVELANQIQENYQPKTVEDMQNVLKDIFGPMFEAMLKGEMDNHIGYESNNKNKKETDNRRNGSQENLKDKCRRSGH